MKHTLTLAAWNIRLARRSLMLVWGVFAAQQTALIAWSAARPNGAGAGLAPITALQRRFISILPFT